MSNPQNSVGKPLARRAQKIGPKANDGGPKADGDGKKGGRRERQKSRGLFQFLGILLKTWLMFYQEFSQRIVNLDQEKAELHAELGKKTIEIVEMHKEVEEKSEQLAEKAKQIDALLMQLNESARFLN
jgi:hypothetical protein